MATQNKKKQVIFKYLSGTSQQILPKVIFCFNNKVNTFDARDFRITLAGLWRVYMGKKFAITASLMRDLI